MVYSSDPDVDMPDSPDIASPSTPDTPACDSDVEMYEPDGRCQQHAECIVEDHPSKSETEDRDQGDIDIDDHPSESERKDQDQKDTDIGEYPSKSEPEDQYRGDSDDKELVDFGSDFTQNNNSVFETPEYDHETEASLDSMMYKSNTAQRAILKTLPTRSCSSWTRPLVPSSPSSTSRSQPSESSASCQQKSKRQCQSPGHARSESCKTPKGSQPFSRSRAFRT